MSAPRAHIHDLVGTALSIALLGFALNGIANAGEAPAPAVKVSYHDLNLSHPKDAKTLHRRLAKASATVCGNFSESPLWLRIEWQRCYTETLNKAVMAIK